MLLTLVIACASPAPVVGDTLTEGGTWRLTLDTTDYDAGAASPTLTAMEATTGDDAAGLHIYARPDMPDMDHTLDVVDFVEDAPGRYHADLTFDMAGMWSLTGYASDAERTESFTFVVEVHA